MSLAPSSSDATLAGRNSKYKYVELTQNLMRSMARRQMRVGDRLGTEKELCEEYGLSRITVRQALSILEADGYIYRKQNKGTFVKRSVGSASDMQILRGTIVVAIENNMGLDPVESTAEFTLFRALERELAVHGFSVRVIGLGDNTERDRSRLLHAVGDSDVEGVCAIGPSFEPYRSTIGDLPLISTATFHPTDGIWVGTNAQSFTRTCVDHLIQKGHREIALVCGSWIDDRGLMGFIAGYREACESHGIPFYRDRVYHACQDESLVGLARQAMSSRVPPTAIFVEGWRGCNAVLAAASELGISIPDQLSLIGSGQNVLNIKVPLPITTYVSDNEQLGRHIGDLLTQMIDGGSMPDEPIWIEGEIIEQGSVQVLNQHKS
ncbi:substrate-binding domain-containing protein [Poriferisphaera sp. WC338]|uniref:substrate-binding domain-containing protein n=1 Tax=Poriferisphaera sp. WC338 TaxID=3425129 RepID=UPI003D81471A